HPVGIRVLLKRVRDARAVVERVRNLVPICVVGGHDEDVAAAGRSAGTVGIGRADALLAFADPGVRVIAGPRADGASPAGAGLPGGLGWLARRVETLDAPASAGEDVPAAQIRRLAARPAGAERAHELLQAMAGGRAGRLRITGWRIMAIGVCRARQRQMQLALSGSGSAEDRRAELLSAGAVLVVGRVRTPARRWIAGLPEVL